MLWLVFLSEFPLNSNTMAETIDLSGDGGVLKTVVRRAKDDAISPSDSLPLVDGTAVDILHSWQNMAIIS
jgi:hypothetical protein